MTVYSNTKILQHLDILLGLKLGEPQPPIHIHFMPSLVCNHSCLFCAYGLDRRFYKCKRKKRRNEQMITREIMPLEKMRECLLDWHEIGVKAIEITGGGEPLLYPHITDLIYLLNYYSFDWALVSNGTRLTKAKAKNFTGFKWCRISIDAACSDTYCKLRNTHSSDYKKAWDAVKYLSSLKSESDSRVGVGFVVCDANYTEVYRASILAKDAGADNIRISLAYFSDNEWVIPSYVINVASNLARKAAADLTDDNFIVFNLISPRQECFSKDVDFTFCPMKEILCVVGGDQHVYTCCSLSFNEAGLLGSIKNTSFKDLWMSQEKVMKYREHNPQSNCIGPCLYYERNEIVNQLLLRNIKEIFQVCAAASSSLHHNFL